MLNKKFFVFAILFFVSFQIVSADSIESNKGGGEVPIGRIEISDAGETIISRPKRLLFELEENYALQIRRVRDDYADFIFMKLGENYGDIEDFMFLEAFRLREKDAVNVDLNGDGIADVYLEMKDINDVDYFEGVEFFVGFADKDAVVSRTNKKQLKEMFDEEELEEFEKIINKREDYFGEKDDLNVLVNEVENDGDGTIDDGQRGLESFEEKNVSNKSLIEFIADLIWLIFGDENGRRG